MATARARRGERRRTQQAIAAGGVVLRGTSSGREVVLTGRRSDGTWVFPKGTPANGETIEQTAAREVREETGLEVRILRPLGPVEYWFTSGPGRVHKLVQFFLMEATGGDVSLHDHEYDDVRWVPIADARRMLTFDTYREVLDRALEASDLAAT